MTNKTATIDLIALCKLPVQQKLDCIKLAQIFGVIADDKRWYVESYVNSHKIKVDDEAKPITLFGGPNEIVKSIHAGFPYVFEFDRSQMLNGAANRVVDFVKLHQISFNDYVSFVGTDQHDVRQYFICFKHKADAVMAKLHFEKGKLLPDLTANETHKDCEFMKDETE